MIKTHEYNTGIESKIFLIQRFIDIKLNKKRALKFGISLPQTTEIYGKLDIVRINGQNRLMWREGHDYEPFTMDDRKPAKIGFRVLDRKPSNMMWTSNIDVIFTINTKETGYIDREQSISECYSALTNCGYINEVNGFKEGVEDVFSGLDVSAIEGKDISPWQVFSFTCNITYEA